MVGTHGTKDIISELYHFRLDGYFRARRTRYGLKRSPWTSRHWSFSVKIILHLNSFRIIIELMWEHHLEEQELQNYLAAYCAPSSYTFEPHEEYELFLYSTR